jgi:hypothetical protein
MNQSDSKNAYGLTDAGKRASEIVTMHAIAGSAGKWVALRLIDGGSDNVLYDTRADAIRHQFYEEYCAYVMVQPCGMTAREGSEWLALNRSLYDAGWHLADPDHAAINPVRQEDAQSKMRQLAANKVR